MKVRTVNDLQDLIDEEMSWRKKELSAIRANIKTSRSFAKDTAIRAGITLLYAHWEGAIKNIAEYYLCYISTLKLPYNELNNNFLAVSVKNELQTFIETNKSTQHKRIVDSIFSMQSQSSKIPYVGIIKTNSNLNSTIFVEIMTLIGLDYCRYESSFKLIDEVLLKMRNGIAHGEKLELIDLDEERFDEIYIIITGLISDFSNQVSNYASQKLYRKP